MEQKVHKQKSWEFKDINHHRNLETENKDTISLTHMLFIVKAAFIKDTRLRSEKIQSCVCCTAVTGMLQASLCATLLPTAFLECLFHFLETLPWDMSDA